MENISKAIFALPNPDIHRACNSLSALQARVKSNLYNMMAGWMIKRLSGVAGCDDTYILLKK